MTEDDRFEAARERYDKAMRLLARRLAAIDWEAPEPVTRRNA